MMIPNPVNVSKDLQQEPQETTSNPITSRDQSELGRYSKVDNFMSSCSDIPQDLESPQKVVHENDISKYENVDDFDEANIITDYAIAIKKAKEHRDSQRPRIPDIKLPGYAGLEGTLYPITTSVFSQDGPSLADMGVGLSHYFELLRVLGQLFLIMFVLGIPSIVITFIANPDAAQTALAAGGPLAVLRILAVSGMFKVSGSSGYGCDTRECVVRGGGQQSAPVLAGVVIYADILYSLLLLLAVPWLHRRLDRRTDNVRQGHLTPTEFSLLVWGVPGDVTQEEIRDHFDRILFASAEKPLLSEPPPIAVGSPASQLAPERAPASQTEVGHAEAPPVPLESGGADVEGLVGDLVFSSLGRAQEGDRVGGDRGAWEWSPGVVWVQLARRDGAALSALRRLAAAQEDLDHLRSAMRRAQLGGGAAGAAEAGPETVLGKHMMRAAAAVEELQRSIGERVDLIRAMRAGGPEPVVCGFVVFGSRWAREEALAQYFGRESRASGLRRWLPRWAGGGQRKEYRLRDRHFLTLVEAPAPGDVLWENLEFAPWQRVCRRGLSALAMLVMVLISLAVIAWDKTYTQSLQASLADCTRPDFAHACNAAFNWSAAVPTAAATVAAVGGTCATRAASAAATVSGVDCSLWELWGASGIPVYGQTMGATPASVSSAAVAATAGPLRMPLDVNTTLIPAQLFMLNGNPCRYASARSAAGNGIQNFTNASSQMGAGGEWLRPEQLSTACIGASGVTRQQWEALVFAGRKQVASDSTGGGSTAAAAYGAAAAAAANNSACDRCLCTALMFAAPSVWAVSFDLGVIRAAVRAPAAEGGAAPCTTQAADLAWFSGLQGAAIAVMVVFNLLISMAANGLAKFDRHLTVTGLEDSVTFRVALGQFCNTFLVEIKQIPSSPMLS